MYVAAFTKKQQQYIWKWYNQHTTNITGRFQVGKLSVADGIFVVATSS